VDGYVWHAYHNTLGFMRITCRYDIYPINQSWAGKHEVSTSQETGIAALSLI